MAVLVTHSTEGSWESALATFKAEPGKQPHRLVDPELKRFKDYIPWNKPAKALKNLPGGVETNNRPEVYQVEIVGLAKTMPMKSTQWYLNLAEMLLDICKITGVPVKFPCPFNKQQRLSNDAWMTVEGIIGHKDVPENDHTDPGDIGRVIPIMLELITGENEMPSIKDLGLAVLTLDQLYINATGVPAAMDVKRSWGKDFATKLAKGEDLTPTFEYIAWKLAGN